LFFVLGNPAVIVEPRAVLGALGYVKSFADTSQFSSVSGFFSLSKLVSVPAYLLPFGLGIPLLLLSAAALVVAVAGLRGQRRYTVPLLAFGAIVLFAMGKGYLAQAHFVRSMMLLFPVLSMLVGLAGWQAWTWLEGRPVARRLLAALATLCIVFTLIVDLDYGRAMATGDPRQDLRHVLRHKARKQTITIGQGPNGHGYFVVDPALTGVNVRRVTLDDRVDEWRLDGVDYVVSGDLGALDVDPRVPAVEAKLSASPRFTLLRQFDRKPATLRAMERWFGRAPHDMLYPFPVLRLYRMKPASPE
jgi:hypothetical protein